MALLAAHADILACVLGHLAPRSLTVSRSVCKGWRAIVDDYRLLRTDLLPLSLHGIFFMEELCPDPPKLFANPLTKHRIDDASLGYVKNDEGSFIENHCNGLLLLWNHLVVNPATRQWVRLPPPPPRCTGMEDFRNDVCLVYDPTVSPHYDVLLLPCVSYGLLDCATTIFTEESEWPPLAYPIQVFSSRTWRWEERSLARRGEAAGTIADMDPYRDYEHRYAVYWKGAIYVHCQNDSILRITLTDGSYEVIKSPTGSKMEDSTNLYLGKSKKGVYCTLIYNDTWGGLQIWLLTESCGKWEWVLKNGINFAAAVAKFSWFSRDENQGPWILQKGDCDENVKEAPVQDNYEWDFDNGIILAAEDKVESDDMNLGVLYFLGFHPFKEIVFLRTQARVVAYDFSRLKVQDLGQLRVQCVGSVFPYTPCWTGDISEKN
ncbi:uncharacterized protein LOC119293221 [Triticum dicoccoides]|uniref:uncharacterized protein LOC119293221 n=1 Tax=Triticum dicoccoides TaxID=85692 RepID=UPI0018903B51|nr:uncharacterized protein LOC119293221 [Triticum dicoccoides]